MPETTDLRVETVLCFNCGALSRSGYAIPEGRCGGVDMGTTTHDWIVPSEEVELFDDPTTFQPQSAELEMSATTDHVVRFSFTDREPMVTFSLWAEEKLPDANKVVEVSVPGDVATELARRPERCRYAAEVDGVTVWISASLSHSTNAEAAKDAEVIEA